MIFSFLGYCCAGCYRYCFGCYYFPPICFPTYRTWILINALALALVSLLFFSSPLSLRSCFVFICTSFFFFLRLFHSGLQGRRHKAQGKKVIEIKAVRHDECCLFCFVGWKAGCVCSQDTECVWCGKLYMGLNWNIINGVPLLLLLHFYY